MTACCAVSRVSRMAGECGCEFALLRLRLWRARLRGARRLRASARSGGALASRASLLRSLQRPVLQAAFEALGLAIPSGAARRPGWRCRARRRGALRCFASSRRVSSQRGCGREQRRAFRLCRARLRARRASAACRAARASTPVDLRARGLPPVTVTLWKHSPDGREEEGARIFKCERAGGACIGRDVAIAQLGQDHFERAAEAVEHADAVLQPHDAVAAGLACRWARWGRRRTWPAHRADERGRWRGHRRRSSAGACLRRRRPSF